MKLMEALETKNLMVVNGNRWMVLKNGSYTVFEHRVRRVTDEVLFCGPDEEAAVQMLLDRERKLTSHEEA